MALSYTYKVRNLKVKDEVNSEGVTLQNAVVQTYGTIIGTDENGNAGEWSGATPFSAANVPAGSFTAFENLEEANVISWIENVVNNDAQYKAHIDEQLRLEISKTVETEVAGEALPWGTPAAEPDASEGE